MKPLNELQCQILLVLFKYPNLSQAELLPAFYSRIWNRHLPIKATQVRVALRYLNNWQLIKGSQSFNLTDSGRYILFQILKDTSYDVSLIQR